MSTATIVGLICQITPVLGFIIGVIFLISKMIRSKIKIVRYATLFVLSLIVLTVFMALFVWENTYSISINNDGELIAITTNRGVWIYRIEDGKKIHHESAKPYSESPYQGYFSYIEWSPDGTSLAIGQVHNGLLVWDTNTWDILTKRDSDVTSDNYNEPSFSWSPDGKQLVFGSSDGEIMIWDKETDKWNTIASPGRTVKSVTWTSNNEILMLNGHEIVNVETRVYQSYLDHWIDGAGKVSWSDDGSHVYIFFDLGGGVMDVIKNEYEFGAGTFPRFAWSKDGRYFASVIQHGNEIFVWDTKRNQIIRNEEQGSMIDALAWTPNDELIASGVMNGKRLLWNTETGEEVMKMNKFFNSWTSLLLGVND